MPELPRSFVKDAQLITTPVASRDDYVVRRWIRTAGPDDGTGIAMWSGCTLGLGEIFAFPASLAYASSKSRELHRFRVWYSPDGHYIFHQWTPRFTRTESSTP
jgi:hypothetical protein